MTNISLPKRPPTRRVCYYGTAIPNGAYDLGSRNEAWQAAHSVKWDIPRGEHLNVEEDDSGDKQ